TARRSTAQRARAGSRARAGEHAARGWSVLAALLLRRRRVGNRLGGPPLVHGHLLVHTHALRDLVPLLGNVIEDALGIAAGPKLAHGLTPRLLVLVGLHESED